MPLTVRPTKYQDISRRVWYLANNANTYTKDYSFALIVEFEMAALLFFEGC